MIRKTFLKITSTLLSLVLLFQFLPLQSFAAETQRESTAPVQEVTEAHVVAEMPEKRTEYTKTFRLSNGFQVAAVYAEPVHYQTDGQWAEIDNTLKLTGSGGSAHYTNTAGVWEVAFPQQLGGSNAVRITKDGHTLSFWMNGELRGNGGLETANAALSEMRISNAQIEELDATAARESAKYPETVVTRSSSRIRYNNIYANTDVIYDLRGNRVKESIVMDSYDSALRGYSYRLEADGMVPVLSDNGQILLYRAGKKDIVMVMPAPYLVDAAGAYCEDVAVSLVPEGGYYTLTYMLPQAWLKDAQRQWPVILDPVVIPDMHERNIRDITVSMSSQESHVNATLECGRFNSTDCRIMLRYEDLPDLTSADVIVDAEVTLYKCMTSDGDRLVTVHKLGSTWDSTTVAWSYFGTASNFDSTVVDYQIVRAEGHYSWDVTDIVREWYEGENTGMAFCGPEGGTANVFAQFYSSDFDSTNSTGTKPALAITFRNNNGLESYWDYTVTSAGRAGTGYVNNYTGNLVWIRDDIGFGGNRMPVSISHVYNASDSEDNSFGMGYGWRTNFNQLIHPFNSYYAWDDSDGTTHYFEHKSGNTYTDEDGLNLTLTVTTAGYTLSDRYGNCSYFDTAGRLTKQENNQATKSSINITYKSSTGYLIDTIKDGINRTYTFTYNSSDLLNRISYKGSGSTELSYVSFGYSGSKLTSITDEDGKTTTYTYWIDNHLNAIKDIDGYEIWYGYTYGEPARVWDITELHDSAMGGQLSFTYAHNQTTVEDIEGNVQIMQFNNWGNTVSIQDGEGRAQYATYATDSSSGAKGNQLNLASKLQNTVGNILDDSSFEGNTLWTATSTAVTRAISSSVAYYGSKSLQMTRATAGTDAGLYSGYFNVAAGKTYTFSAYVKTGSGMTAYLALHDGSTSVASETLAAGSDWTRLQVTYTNTSNSSKTVRARLMTTTAGTAYIDCAQVEIAATASRYNLVENGDFNYTTRWSPAITQSIVTPAAQHISNKAYMMTGDPAATNRISQTVKVSGNQGDSFVLAGWAKGDSAPLRDNREFSLIATFLNSSGASVGSSKVTFNPDNNSSVAWQYAAAAMIAPAAYSSIKIELAYDYNVNTVYFDGIQLYKEEFGTSYTYDANGNVTSVKDLQKQITQYQYTNNNLTKQVMPTGAELTYTYDNYHNVLTAKSATGVNYSFTYDTYGNNTSVSILSGSVKLTSSAAYTSDGNRLSSTTDAAGKVTTYSYNANTNVLEWVQYPEDTTATRTEYTYDNMYRLAKTEADVSTGSTLTASYGYTNDLLTSITTGSTVYSFNYGSFGLRSNIKIGSRTLASYSYTNRTNYLSRLDYGNSDSVQYTYDQQGRVTKQTYEDGDTVTYKYDNNGALATVTDSATGRTTTYYYDFTDRLMKYVESGSGYNHSVGYQYDNINNLTALVETINGVKHTTSYTYDRDNRVSKITNGSTSEAYTYDDYSRMRKKVAKDGSTTVLTDTLTYRLPTSVSTTGQVTTLNTAASNYNVTYTYTYDDNGNILSVSTGANNTTSYVYDSANQLIRENNQAAGKTWAWTYDDAGNITSRKEYAYTLNALGTAQSTVNYTYNGTWGDLLTGWNGKTITSDTIGNMTSDGTWSYTWEHGRELASMSGGGTTWNFTYNADGLRTKRTNGSTTYSYVYNGSSLSQMTVGSNTLYFAYDASGTPLSVTYNGTSYYYATNIQGDVTAILNTSGTAVVQYTYDAWGKLLTTTGSMASTLGTHNPLRYRGYVYDTETGLYYVSSRYYDPEIGRFINADDVDLLGANGDFASLNLFAYCGNNPVARVDSNGHFWEAIGIGFVAGIVGQYISDVIGNIQSGQTGVDIFTPTSSASDYLASGIGGAIAAIPGLNLVGTMAVGAVGSVVSDGLKGNINSWEDLGKSALKGGVANGIGYGVAKGMAALKVKQISNMPRSSRKVYLRDNFYCNSQVNANVNLQTFANSSMAVNIGIVETQVAIFRSGVYSTVTSTFATLF